MAVQVFGIRHHGPGSARLLINQLDTYQPDCVLVEGPPDADDLIPQVNHPDMSPPVALLVYPADDIERASFFPFAEFSPEWQALRWALAHHCKVQFMDLPMAQQFSLSAPAAFLPRHSGEQAAMEYDMLPRDPFSRIARLAGFQDPERWWDSLIERNAPAHIFPAILDLMTTLRHDSSLDGRTESPETLLREAAMRQIIRAAQRAGYQRIAVVCGAWHAPALAAVNSSDAADDAAALQKIQKKHVETLWIPYTFERLALATGYGAGVQAPFWYQLLFTEDKNALVRWMALAAETLRLEGVSVSSVQVIEAVRLAETLARLRGSEFAGIDELRDAAQSVLSQGNPVPMAFLDSKLVVGQQMGAVPEQQHRCPLKVDFLKQIRKVGLKISAHSEIINLDLRKEKHLQRSQLLHRLTLLGIHWGTEIAVQGKKQGSFHENWELRWQPVFEMYLIDKSILGNTLAAAAEQAVAQAVHTANQLTSVVSVLERTLKANLPDALPFIFVRLEQIAAADNDVSHLTHALLSLARALRYGQVRQLNLPNIEQVVERISTRICLQLPSACQFLDDQAAGAWLETLVHFNRAVALLNRHSISAQWTDCLMQLSKGSATAATLAGFATRLLFDKNITTSGQTAIELSYRLSRADEFDAAARWLEGFLHGSGLLLIHHHDFWNILDNWLESLETDCFRQVLPLLRRTFARFEMPERQKMLAMARTHRSETLPMVTDSLPDLPCERVRALSPVFQWLVAAE